MDPRPPLTVRVVPVALEAAPGLPASALAALASVLDAGERARAAALRFPADRARFVVSHAALRCCLAERLGRPAEQVRFRYGPFGKPALNDDDDDDDGDGPGGAAVFFNMSHSRTVALVGLAPAELGVDVEDVSLDVDELGLGRHVFAASEQQALARLCPGTPRREAFFALWARKEALLKAMGTGLSLDPRRLDLGPPGRSRDWHDAPTSRRWTLTELWLGPRHRAALAVQGRLAGVDLRPRPLTPAEVLSRLSQEPNGGAGRALGVAAP